MQSVFDWDAFSSLGDQGTYTEYPSRLGPWLSHTFGLDLGADLQLVFPDALLECRLSLFVALFCTAALGLLYLTYNLRQKAQVLPGTRAALMSMYAVITPTQSLWPQHYLSLARSVAASNTKCIRFSLGTLYRDLLDDVVELRSSGEHLPSLFAGQLGADASLHLDVEPSWWFKLIWWMLCCNLRSGSVEFRPNSKHKHANTPATDNSQLVLTPPPPYPRLLDDPPDVASAPPSTLFYSVLYENAPSISLDCVPYHALESAIRRLQGSLTTGSHLTIGFTTRAGPHAHSLRHPDVVISALPFFPRAYMKRRKWSFGGEADGARTTTPLFLTLPHALALFTSGPTPLTVELVRNVSQEYAMFLRRSVHDLEDDREIRDAFVREWGVAGWREERVCTAWEAALINAGLLAGWAIVVRK